MAQAGQLDQSFGAGGVFTTNTTQPFHTAGAAVAVQSDGRIVVGGVMEGLGSGRPSLLRLTTSGGLDATFGTGGVVNLTLPPELEGGDGALVVAVAIQSDGKIVTSVSDLLADAAPAFILARLNPDGSLDTSFGNQGFGVMQNFDSGNVLALQPDGKILLAGNKFMARYGTDGQPDTTFGTGGLAILKNFAGAMAVQLDGRILVAAGGFPQVDPFFPVSLGPHGRGAGVVSRYNPDGSLDPGFGIFGQAACVALASATVVQSDGEIVLAGLVTDALLPPPAGPTEGFGLVRYNTDGGIDTSFGAQGGVITDFGSTAPFASPRALALQTDGKLIAAGAAGDQRSSSFALVRYTTSGNRDIGFGSGGAVVTSFGSNLASVAALAVQSDGKIVAVGNFGFFESASSFVNNIAVVRYLGQ